MKKTGFTLDQHRDHAKKIKDIRDYLVHLVVEISHGYNITSKQLKTAKKAQYWFEEMRSDLDSAACKELHGRHDVDYLKLYYPGPEQKP